MELLVNISKEKTQQTLLENAMYCAALLGTDKAKELFPQYTAELEKNQPSSVRSQEEDRNSN
jgi:hypothetical protein